MGWLRCLSDGSASIGRRFPVLVRRQWSDARAESIARALNELYNSLLMCMHGHRLSHKWRSPVRRHLGAQTPRIRQQLQLV